MAKRDPFLEFELEDLSDRFMTKSAPLGVAAVIESGGLRIDVDGYNNGDGVLFLEFWESKLRVHVWENPEDDSPTQTIDLECVKTPRLPQPVSASGWVRGSVVDRLQKWRTERDAWRTERDATPGSNEELDERYDELTGQAWNICDEIQLPEVERPIETDEGSHGQEESQSPS